MPDVINDALLLQNYIDHQDAEAFSELSRRYAGMVFGTCLRITRNPHDAEDIAQECFIELAKRQEVMTTPVSGWLHRTATNKSLNSIRDDSTRKKYEDKLEVAEETEGELSWEDVAPHVDRALEDLPEELRSVVVLHFLEGKTQNEVSALLEINQSTVSRRIEKGVEQLRDQLRKSGVIASVALLSTLIVENSASAAPVTLTQTLGKIALSGFGQHHTAAATTSGLFSTIQAKLVVAAIVAAALAVIIIMDNDLPKPPTVPAPGMQSATTTAGPPEQQQAPPTESVNPAPPKPDQKIEVPKKEKKITMPDYTTARLRGNGFVKDSFCLALAEASRLLGRPVSYDDIMAATTNAFAPGFDTGNDCKELWGANAWVSHLGISDATGQYLGLKLEQIKHPDPKADAAKAEYRQQLLTQIKEAIAQGKVVITSGGWNYKTQWVEPWWAGIIVEVQKDGTVLGAHPNGRNDCVLENLNSGELYAVSLTPSPDKKKATLPLLKSFVKRIRAQGPKGSFSRHPYCAFGVDAMDEWIKQFGTVKHFCPVCYEKSGKSWESALAVTNHVSHRCDIAAKWLREVSKDTPQDAKTHLLDAAECYETISLLLKTESAHDGYKDIVGNMDRQKEHAEKVLKPVKEELLVAADAIDKAIAALDKR